MMLKAIHASEDLSAAREKAEAVIQKLKKQKLPQAAKKVSKSIDETLTYYEFPSAHWRRIRTAIRLNAFCVRSDEERALLVPFLMATLP